MKNRYYLNRNKIYFFVLTFISFSLGAQEHLSTLNLWYNKLATHFEEALPLGEVKGLCARGGFVVDLQWKDMKLTEGTLLSKMGGTCTLRTYVPLKVIGASVKSRKDGIYYLTKLATKAGKQYKLLPKNN